MYGMGSPWQPHSFVWQTNRVQKCKKLKNKNVRLHRLHFSSVSPTTTSCLLELLFLSPFLVYSLNAKFFISLWLLSHHFNNLRQWLLIQWENMYIYVYTLQETKKIWIPKFKHKFTEHKRIIWNQMKIKSHFSLYFFFYYIFALYLMYNNGYFSFSPIPMIFRGPETFNISVSLRCWYINKYDLKCFNMYVVRWKHRFFRYLILDVFHIPYSCFSYYMGRYYNLHYYYTFIIYDLSKDIPLLPKNINVEDAFHSNALCCCIFHHYYICSWYFYFLFVCDYSTFIINA